jgi:Lon protease-like protein
MHGALVSAIEIPTQCGVMLLPDCTLFPHGGLPLRIFEPRYRGMLADALEGDCVFAVGRLLTEETEDPQDCVAPVGTVGLIRASRLADDGTSQLLLHGVLRVRFVEWHEEREYPLATIEPMASEFEPKEQAEAAMKTLRAAVEDAVFQLPDEVQQGVFSLLDQADEPGIMTDIICQQFVHDPDLRQQLLEIESVGDRIPVICDYLGRGGQE